MLNPEGLRRSRGIQWASAESLLRVFSTAQGKSSRGCMGLSASGSLLPCEPPSAGAQRGGVCGDPLALRALQGPRRHAQVRLRQGPREGDRL
eukprot:gene154-biopygen208